MHGNQQTEQQAKGKAGQRQLVGQQLGFGVGEDETEQEKSEDAVFQRSDRQSGVSVTAEKENSGQHFDEQVARRNSGFAMAAAAAKKQPTEDGQVVVKSNRPLAIWARRTRRHHRQAQGHAIDTHVQKAAKGQPEEKHRRCKKWVH